MKHQTKIRAFLLTVAISLTSQAFAAEKPPTCPSVSSLRQVKFAYVTKIPKGWFMLQPLSHYDTKNVWLFGFVADGKNQQVAYQEMRKYFPTMKSSPGAVNVEGEWFCRYAAAKGYSGQARVMHG